MTRYAMREYIPADYCKGSLDYLAWVTARMKRRLLERLERNLMPGQPLAIRYTVEEDIDAYGNRETTMELETVPIRTLDDVLYHPTPPVLKYEEYKKLSPPSKPPLLTRLKNWWKEMQKPLPYDDFPQK